MQCMSIIRMREEEDRISQTKYNSNLALALSAVRITLYFASFFFAFVILSPPPECLPCFAKTKKKKTITNPCKCLFMARQCLLVLLIFFRLCFVLFWFLPWGFRAKNAANNIGEV